MRRFGRILGALLVLAGLAVFFSPTIYSLWFQRQSAQAVTLFQQTIPSAVQSEDTSEGWDKLRQSMAYYNETIYRNKQSGLVDVWSYETIPAGLEPWSSQVMGYVTIPTMEVELPLYLGATTENMAKGAVVLGQTSMPIGGANTNCVIAGHRGYQGAPYFREIERLSVGDLVCVTNPWKTLTYVVSDIEIIQPDELEPVLIQDGKDMITLMSCHPYRSHGKYRYVVYCVREGSDSTENQVGERNITTSSPEIVFTSSETDIRLEQTARMAGVVLIGAAGIILFLPNLRRKTK